METSLKLILVLRTRRAPTVRSQVCGGSLFGASCVVGFSLRNFIVAREIEWVKASVLMMGHGVRAHVSRAASPEFPVFHSCFEG